MKTIKTHIEIQQEIKKSKFIAHIFSVDTEEKSKQILEELKKKYKDATHIVYAYVLYSPSIEKCSDDGEPSGTAGKPILDIIKKNDLTNVLIVVVRYFGGIKLGAGGLVRAYSSSAKIAVDNAQIEILRNYYVLQVNIAVDKRYLIDNNKDINVIYIDYSNIASKIVKYKISVAEESGVYEELMGMCSSCLILDKKLM